MADAKKCDRCGALYEKPVCNPILQITQDNHPYSPIHIDLCPQCYEELKQWLQDKNELKNK